jgi:uncharacterized protein (TIGR00251 family)
MSCFEERDGYIVLKVRVVPRAAKNAIQGLRGDALKIRIQAPPVDGKANACLIRFLSRHWNIPQADIELLSGETGRNKRLRILNPTDEMRAALLSLSGD